MTFKNIFTPCNFSVSIFHFLTFPLLSLVFFSSPGIIHGQELKPLQNNDLRNISGEQGLNGGLSFQEFSAEPRIRPENSYELLGTTSPFLVTKFDSPLVGDYLLSDFLWKQNLSYRATDDDDIPLPFIFKAQQNNLQQGVFNPDLAGTFQKFISNDELVTVVGKVPEEIAVNHGL